MRAWLAFSLSVCSWACEPSQPPLRVDSLRFEGPSQLLPTAVGRASLERVLQADPRVRLSLRAAKTSPSCSSTGPVRVVATLRPHGDASGPLRLRLQATPVCHTSGATVHYVSERPVPADAVLAERLDDVMAACWQGIADLRRLETQGPAAWVAQLSDASAATQSVAELERATFATQRLAQLRHKEAVAPLLEQLHRSQSDSANHATQALALQALGALVAIGDTSAVLSIIDFAQHKDEQLLLQLAYAVGALGGPVAQGWLVTLASGHPDEMVQRAAAEALAEMQLGERRLSGPQANL